MRNILGLLGGAVLGTVILISCNVGTIEEERTFRLTITVRSTVATEVNIEFLDAYADPDGVAWVPVTTSITEPVSFEQSYTGIVDRTEERSVRVSSAYTLAGTADSVSVLITYEELVPDLWSDPQVLLYETDEYKSDGSAEQSNIIQKNILIPTP